MPQNILDKVIKFITTTANKNKTNNSFRFVLYLPSCTQTAATGEFRIQQWAWSKSEETNLAPKMFSSIRRCALFFFDEVKRQLAAIKCCITVIY
jgi:hypothetical protein